MSNNGKLRTTQSGHAAWCPGCKEYHIIDSRWTFNGNFDAPTFTPSLLVAGGSSGDSARCHSFIKNGNWEYLSDSSHGMTGQTVPMRTESENWDWEDSEEVRI